MLLSHLPEPEFFQRAACRGEDPELFFPVGDPHSPVNVDQIARAEAVCHGCPVQADCLSWALETGQRDGIWGGMTEHDRRGIRRQDRQEVA